MTRTPPADNPAKQERIRPFSGSSGRYRHGIPVTPNMTLVTSPQSVRGVQRRQVVSEASPMRFDTNTSEFKDESLSKR